MVGGKVIEVIDCGEKIWINCRGTGCESKQECAIYVRPTVESVKITPGDTVWWQGRLAFWTRYIGGEQVGSEDVEIPRIGYSGVFRPQPEQGERSEAR